MPCRSFAFWISFEVYFDGLHEIVDTIKQMSVAYESDKFGWKNDPLVKKFATDYLDHDFSNLCTVIFLGNSFDLVK